LWRDRPSPASASSWGQGRLAASGAVARGLEADLAGRLVDSITAAMSLEVENQVRPA
jgi:hypothetical protein